MSTDDYDITIATGYQTPGRRRNNFTATSAPTTGDDSGDFYEVGSRWVDTTTDTVYTLMDSTLGAAVWTASSGSSSSSSSHTHGYSGEILITDTPAGSPLVFDDLLQNEAGDDLLYEDVAA
jgi:hypothetical protein